MPNDIKTHPELAISVTDGGVRYGREHAVAWAFRGPGLRDQEYGQTVNATRNGCHRPTRLGVISKRRGMEDR